MYNSVLRSNSEMLRRVLKVDLNIHSRLRRCDSFLQAVRQGTPIPLQDLTDDFRHRAHTLKVETVAWDARNSLLCDRCSCDEIQDEAHALLVCTDADVSTKLCFEEKACLPV
eukprot:647567-Pelagomonas_calceolata.AAC.1